MSNGYGPLRRNLNPIVDDDAEYDLGCSWTSSENYTEIWGLDPDRLAGPWGGSPEIDEKAGRVTLPYTVAVKIAAAILLDHVDNVTDPINKDFRKLALPRR